MERIYVINYPLTNIKLSLKMVREEFAKIEAANEVHVQCEAFNNWLAFILGVAMALDKPIYKKTPFMKLETLDDIVEEISAEWEAADVVCNEDNEVIFCDEDCVSCPNSTNNEKFDTLGELPTGKEEEDYISLDEITCPEEDNAAFKKLDEFNAKFGNRTLLGVAAKHRITNQVNAKNNKYAYLEHSNIMYEDVYEAIYDPEFVVKLVEVLRDNTLVYNTIVEAIGDNHEDVIGGLPEQIAILRKAAIANKKIKPASPREWPSKKENYNNVSN